ncbi:MAG: inositol monophosphatase family protein [bacterium]
MNSTITACRAAREAGKLLLKYAQHLQSLIIEEKKPGELVSEADKEAEKIIIQIISSSFPDHAIVAEESGKKAGNDYCWIIDPLDGTTNFLHAVPQWSISIALAYKDEIILGVVYDPNLDELFVAQKNKGATLNDKPIHVSKRSSLHNSLIGTGTPYRDLRFVDQYLQIMKQIIHSGSAGIRRPGSAALDFAWLACGRYDGFWELALAPWDIAAGALMITEAGGKITDLNGGTEYLSSGNIIAGNPHIHPLLCHLIQPNLDDKLDF